MTQMSDIERWLAELNDNDADGDIKALKGLSSLPAHQLLRANLPLAAQVAEAAYPWISRVYGTQQLHPAAIVCRYAADLALWQQGFAWFSKTLQDWQQRDMFVYEVIINWAIVPDYLPYWDEARPELEALFSEVMQLRGETHEGVLNEVSRIAGLKLSATSAPRKPPIAAGDTVTCKQCGGTVERSRAIRAMENYFCGEVCARAYWGNDNWRNPMNW